MAISWVMQGMNVVCHAHGHKLTIRATDGNDKPPGKAGPKGRETT